MANLFGDQLLKAGLVSKDKLNKAKKSRYKQQKAGKAGKQAEAREAAEAARRAAVASAARDRELNEQRKAEAGEKAIRAQVRQLIERNRVSREDAEVGYNFQDGKAIRKLFVTEEMRDKLASGVLSIVRFGDGYEVVPASVADKIRARDESAVITVAGAPDDCDENDPYADYKVPDDLMW